MQASKELQASLEAQLQQRGDMISQLEVRKQPAWTSCASSALGKSKSNTKMQSAFSDKHVLLNSR